MVETEGRELPYAHPVDALAQELDDRLQRRLSDIDDDVVEQALGEIREKKGLSDEEILRHCERSRRGLDLLIALLVRKHPVTEHWKENDIRESLSKSVLTAINILNQQVSMELGEFYHLHGFPRSTPHGALVQDYMRRDRDILSDFLPKISERGDSSSA